MNVEYEARDNASTPKNGRTTDFFHPFSRTEPLKHEALPMTMEMVLATTTDANTLPFIQCIECEKEESVGRRLRVCPNVVIKRFKCKECNELKRERIHYAHHSHYKIDLLRSA